MSTVVGKKVYKQSRCDKLLSEFVTIGDEALAILIFENNFDIWIKMAEKNVTKIPGFKKKYTNGGSAKNQVARSRKHGGWCADGLKRFNELFDMVNYKIS